MRPVAGARGGEAEAAEDAGGVGVWAGHGEAGRAHADLAHVARHVVRGHAAHTHAWTRSCLSNYGITH